jgi:hypothetical protein
VTSVSLAPLVGREPELKLLRACLQETATGRGRLVIVSGDAGIGKTRLAEEFAAEAPEEFAVGWARCAVLPEGPPYWPWRQLLRQVANADDGAASVSEIRDLFDRLTRRAESDSRDTAPWALADDVAAAFAHFSRTRPLLLVMEDLEVADGSTLDVLRYLAPQLRTSAVIILATCEEVTPGRALGNDDNLKAVVRDATLLPLEALSEADTAQLLRYLVGEELPSSLAAAIQEASGGNPLYVQETTRLLQARGDVRRPDHSLGFQVPSGIRDVMRSRLQAVSPEVQALLSLAAVLGRNFKAPVLSEVAKLPFPQVTELLDEAVSERLVEATGVHGDYAFAHVLVRETLYEDLTAFRRMTLHRATAEVLERLFGSEAGEHVGELAHHWFKAAQAGDASRALEYSELAAKQAAEAQAYEEAARLYRRALTLADQAGLERELVRDLQSRLKLVEAARVETAPVSVDVGPSGGSDVFRSEGDFWTVAFEGTVVRLRGIKGFRYLAHLLANPGQDIHVLDLIAVVDAQGLPSRGATGLETAPNLIEGDVGPVLDAAAKTAYRKRIDDLRDELDEAEGFNDPERAARARQELEELVDHLGRAVGLQGRDRPSGSPAERARVAVTKGVREAMRKIMTAHSGLAEHLDATIKTGIYCSYKPDPRAVTRWVVR